MTTPADPTSWILVMNSDLVQSLVTFPFLNMIDSYQFAAITTRSGVAYATNVVAISKRHYQPLLNVMLLKGLVVISKVPNI